MYYLFIYLVVGNEGWEANMDRQKRGVTMAPIVIPGMAR